MQKELQKQLKSFLKGVIFDYHNNNLNQSKVKEEVLDYMFEGIGGDNKFFENYVSFINQNFIGKEEVVGTKNKIEETLRITEENYPNEINISILVERLKVLLELIK